MKAQVTLMLLLASESGAAATAPFYGIEWNPTQSFAIAVIDPTTHKLRPVSTGKQGETKTLFTMSDEGVKVAVTGDNTWVWPPTGETSQVELITDKEPVATAATALVSQANIASKFYNILLKMCAGVPVMDVSDYLRETEGHPWEPKAFRVEGTNCFLPAQSVVDELRRSKVKVEASNLLKNGEKRMPYLFYVHDSATLSHIRDTTQFTVGVPLSNFAVPIAIRQMWKVPRKDFADALVLFFSIMTLTKPDVQDPQAKGFATLFCLAQLVEHSTTTTSSGHLRDYYGVFPKVQLSQLYHLLSPISKTALDSLMRNVEVAQGCAKSGVKLTSHKTTFSPEAVLKGFKKEVEGGYKYNQPGTSEGGNHALRADIVGDGQIIVPTEFRLAAYTGEFQLDASDGDIKINNAEKAEALLKELSKTYALPML